MSGTFTTQSRADYDPPNTLFCLLNFPDEMLMAMLSHLSNSELYLLAQVSRSLNRVAIQQILDRDYNPHPQKHCDLIMDPTSKFNTLSALLISVHINTCHTLNFNLLSYPSYQQIGRPLIRFNRFIMKLTSTEEVAIHFSINGCRTFDDGQLKTTTLIFENLLNTIVAKSCKKLRFMNSRGLLTNHYQFLPNEKIPKSFINGVKHFIARRKDTNLENRVLNDDWKYWRNGSRIFLTCSDVALGSTKLVHVNIGTIDLLAPPFSKWTFTMLHSSSITSLSFNVEQLKLKRRQEAQLMFCRLASALPGLVRLYLDKSDPTMIHDILLWVNQFPLLETLGMQSLSSPLRRDTMPMASYTLKLPKLQSIDGTPELLLYLASHPVDCPVIKFVHISYNCVDGVQFDVPLLAQTIKEVRQSFFNSETTLRIYVKFDPDFPGITQSLCDGVRPSCVEWEEVMMAIDAVRIRIMDSKSTIRAGKYLSKTLGCLTLFPALKSIAFDSWIIGSETDIERFDAYFFDAIKSRCPDLRDMFIQ